MRDSPILSLPFMTRPLLISNGQYFVEHILMFIRLTSPHDQIEVIHFWQEYQGSDAVSLAYYNVDKFSYW